MKFPSHSLLLPGLLVALSQSVAGREKFPGRIGGEGRIGQAAPPFELKAWLNADPLEPADLKGNVLLVRWWTDTCPFCSTTAPVLRELNRKYRGRGLRVIGIFHPKPPGDRSVERLRRATEPLRLHLPGGPRRGLDSAPPLVARPRGTGVDLRFLPRRQAGCRPLRPPRRRVPSGRSWTPLAEPRKLPSGIPRDRRHHSQAPRQLIPTRSNAARAKKDEGFYGRISGFGHSTPRFWLGKDTDDEKDRVFGFSSNVGRHWSSRPPNRTSTPWK